MARSSHQNGVLFGAIMTIGYILVLALWLPQAQQSFAGLFSGIAEGAKGSAESLSFQIQDAKTKMASLVPAVRPETAASGALLSQPATDDVLAEVERILEGEEQPKPQPLSAFDASAKKFCTKSGGVYQTRTSDAHQQQYGICSFSNDSQCEAVMFEYGKCHKGQYGKAEAGIPAKPDLVISATESGEPVTIVNRGWAAATATAVLVNSSSYPVPALPIGGSYTVPAAAHNDSAIVVDPKDINKEIIEENNTAQL